MQKQFAYPKQVLMLPFDHRSSFSRDLLGCTSTLTQEQHAKVSELKHIVYEGFLAAARNSNDAILVDDEYGADILADAKQKGYTIAMPVEKSGQQEFLFDSDDWRERIRQIQPNIVKVLVRYNPANTELNKRQLASLMQLSAFCERNNFPLLFELLVPATKEQESKTYDTTRRPKLVVQAITEIQRFVRVSIWKLEGMSATQWKAVIAATRDEAVQPVFIVLGRNAAENIVDGWLKAGLHYPEVVGFAVGRTIFFKPLEDYVHGKCSRPEAAARIALEFRHFSQVWRKARP